MDKGQKKIDAEEAARIVTREKRDVRRRRVERDPGRRQGGQLSDIKRKIPNSACYSKRDVYVTFEGRVLLRRSDEVKACGNERWKHFRS